MLIERGMPVQGDDGALGTVSEVVADEGVDVFRGLVLSHGLLGSKHGFIPGDRVVKVEQNTVYVRLSKTEADQLSMPPTGGQAYEEKDLNP